MISLGAVQASDAWVPALFTAVGLLLAKGVDWLANRKGQDAASTKLLIDSSVAFSQLVTESEGKMRERLAVVEAAQEACLHREVKLHERMAELEDKGRQRDRLIEQLLERTDPPDPRHG